MTLHKLELQEIKANCNCPKKFTLLDFGGVVLGTFFLIDGYRRSVESKITPPSFIEIGFGALMVYIHSRRFVYAGQLGIE